MLNDIGGRASPLPLTRRATLVDMRRVALGNRVPQPRHQHGNISQRDLPELPQQLEIAFDDGQKRCTIQRGTRSGIGPGAPPRISNRCAKWGRTAPSP
jgi:hypothetical protein